MPLPFRIPKTDNTITSPLTSFNEVSVAELYPAAQGDFIYGINNVVFISSSYSGGSISGSNGFGIVKSGTSVTGSALISLRRNLKYRPGFGSLIRATCLFDTPVSGNAQLIGVGNIECGYYFGYYGTQFGILHQETSQIEIRKLTVTTPAGTETITITLNGVSVGVPVVGGGDANQTSYQIAKYDFRNVGVGWQADAVDGTVYFTAGVSGPFTGSYSAVGSSTFVGTFAGILTGSTGTSSFIPQSSWNIDQLCSNCGSEFVLNPQKGNVYQIGFQYLGFGNAFFGIENPETGRITPVHMIKNTNARTTAVLKNPQMTTTLISKNFGSSTSVQPKSLSMAAFTEGFARKLDPRFAASHTFSGYNSTTKAPLLALKINAVYNNQTCFAEFDILRIAASNESTNKTLTISVYKNLDINGAVNFQYVDQANSAVSYANLTPGTNTVTTTGKVPFLTFSVGANNAATIDIAPEELVFGAGEIVVICISTSGAVTGEVGVNWFEQQ